LATTTLHLTLFRSAIDKIAGKNHPAIAVAKDAIVVMIVHFPQQAAQHLGVTVDVTNDVIITCDHELLSVWVRQSSSQRRFA
jgi:hypothetical protein